MKKTTTLGLVAIAALALAAIGGASSASAESQLCSKTGTGSACGGTAPDNLLTVGESLEAKSETPNVSRFTSGFVNVTCGWFAIKFSMTRIIPPIPKFTKTPITDCHSNLNTTSGSCTAESTASPSNGWPGTITTSGTGPNGKMEVENAEFQFTCNILGTNITCKYGAAKIGDGHSTGEEIRVNGGQPATIEALHVELSKKTGSASSCSASAFWEGTYTVTSPASLYST